jgi:hypothetical protein
MDIAVARARIVTGIRMDISSRLLIFLFETSGEFDGSRPGAGQMPHRTQEHAPEPGEFP